MSHIPCNYELLLTNPDISKIRSISTLQKYGHTFRKAKECPKGYVLYEEETNRGFTVSFTFRNGHKIYQKKLGYGRDTQTAG